jgi:Bacterial membrane protein YfhO
MGALCFVQPLITLMASVPGVEAVRWPRSLVLVAFTLAVLGGLGLELLIRSPLQQSVRRWVGSGFLLTAVILLGFCLAGGGPLTPAEASHRLSGLVWSAIEALLGIAVVVSLRFNARRSSQGSKPRTMLGLGLSQWCAIVLLACETAFLVAAGAPIWDSSPSYLPVTSTELALERAVGSSVVGLGASECEHRPGVGIRPDVNAMLGIQELAAYDPMIPVAYFHSWKAVTGQPSDSAGFKYFSTFCPAITSAAIARAYGVGFVLEEKGAHPPTGGIFDENVGDETLYRIPDSGVATLTPISPAQTTSDSVTVPVTHPGPASWKLITHGTTAQLLQLRLTDSPGWHATIDGRTLKLTPYQDVMIKAEIPAGTHTVILTYWPRSFTAGIVVALCSAIALMLALLSGRFRKRRQPAVVEAESQPATEHDPSALQPETSDEDTEQRANRQARTRPKRPLRPDDEDAEQRANRQARTRLKEPIRPDDEGG